MLDAMTIALRQQLRPGTLPGVSFGPFSFLMAMPWLVFAAAMRVHAFDGGLIAIPAMLLASIAVLHAFLVVTRPRSFNGAGRKHDVSGRSARHGGTARALR